MSCILYKINVGAPAPCIWGDFAGSTLDIADVWATDEGVAHHGKEEHITFTH